MVSFVDTTSTLLNYAPAIGGTTPLRPTQGTGHVPVGRQAEFINGQYYPDRPLPNSYRPLEDPYASSLPIIDSVQDNQGAFGGTFGIVAGLYANQSKYFATTIAAQDQSNGIDIRI